MAKRWAAGPLPASHPNKTQINFTYFIAKSTLNSERRNNKGVYCMDNIKTSSGGDAAAGWYGANPTTTDLKPNPHPHYKYLRETQPVNLTPLGDWRLSNYADIQKLLKHSRSGMRDIDGLIPGETREETNASKFMLRMDPPDHDRLRKLVSNAFTPSRSVCALSRQFLLHSESYGRTQNSAASQSLPMPTCMRC